MSNYFTEYATIIFEDVQDAVNDFDANALDYMHESIDGSEVSFKPAVAREALGTATSTQVRRAESNLDLADTDLTLDQRNMYLAAQILRDEVSSLISKAGLA